jgi:hypothetical protein
MAVQTITPARAYWFTLAIDQWLNPNAEQDWVAERLKAAFGEDADTSETISFELQPIGVGTL